MEIVSVLGISLSETNYSESSKILNVLTKEYCVIGIISKGSRKMKSKLRGVSRKLMYGNYHIYYKENGLSTLIGVDVVNSFDKTIMDLKRVSYASYVLDLIGQISRQNDDEEIFDLLKNTLLKIEEGYNPEILTQILEVQALKFLGVSPSLDGCSVCGSSKNIITIDSALGGYVCSDCYDGGRVVSDKTIKIIRMFYYVDIEKITKLEVSSDVVKDIRLFLDDYYDRYTGLFLKSKNFIKNINRLQE